MTAVNDNTTTHDAREVQRELLPRAVPRFEGLELAGVCRPAIAVGGDCYDYLEHADGRPGLVIADISGKGVPAALLMASLQASVRSLFHLAADPGRDSIRVVAQALNVDSTIDGDLLAAAQELVVTGDARIAGGVVAAGRRVEIDGRVEGVPGWRRGRSSFAARCTATPMSLQTVWTWRPAPASPATSTIGHGRP